MLAFKLAVGVEEAISSCPEALAHSNPLRLEVFKGRPQRMSHNPIVDFMGKVDPLIQVIVCFAQGSEPLLARSGGDHIFARMI
ncbi:hypothetical protein D3C77_226390 [compost metagenome]